MTRPTQLPAFVAWLFLAACAPEPLFVLPNAPIGDAAVQRVYLATDRHLTDDLAGTTERADTLSFVQYDITVPPGHQPGEVEFSPTNPDPAKNFTLAKAESILTRAEFGKIVRSQIGPSGRPLDGTVIYVHGFNTSLEKAVYRHAQIAHDYGLIGPQITYSWPSIQTAFGYVRDKDSTLIARDRLEELLAEVTRDGKEVFIFGHSMGTQLVVETLRQLAITGRRDVLGRIGGVILISPDIDLDLFEAMQDRIDPFPQPFVLMISEQDYALRFSSLLTAEPERLGSARDLERLAALDLLVLDLSGLPNARNHFLAATSPLVIEIVNRVREQDATKPFPRRGIIDVSKLQTGVVK